MSNATNTNVINKKVFTIGDVEVDVGHVSLFTIAIFALLR